MQDEHARGLKAKPGGDVFMSEKVVGVNFDKTCHCFGNEFPEHFCIIKNIVLSVRSRGCEMKCGM